MSRYHSYLNSAVSIIEHYNGDVPLAIYLKKHFNTSKKFGSKDRKQISTLCYNYYRVATALTKNTCEENILIANFLCEKKLEVIENLKPEWNKYLEASLAEKSDIILGSFLKHKIFTFSSELSEGIDPNLFGLSFLIQPDLFIRIRPGYKINTLGKLSDAFIAYNLLGESCLAFPNGTKLDEILKVGTEVIIQDYNSQQIGKILEKFLNAAHLQHAARRRYDFFNRVRDSDVPKTWSARPVVTPANQTISASVNGNSR